MLAQDVSSLTSASKLIVKYLGFLKKHENSSFSLSSAKGTTNDLVDIYNKSLASAYEVKETDLIIAFFFNTVNISKNQPKPTVFS